MFVSNTGLLKLFSIVCNHVFCSLPSDMIFLHIPAVNIERVRHILDSFGDLLENIKKPVFVFIQLGKSSITSENNSLNLQKIDLMILRELLRNSRRKNTNIIEKLKSNSK